VTGRRGFLAAAGGVAALLAACGRRQRLGALSTDSTVLALGDSITWGTGATPETSYPAVLAALTGWKVVNAGVPGDTSAGAVARLPELLQQHQPQLVLVSIGGNDLLRRMPLADLREHVRVICRKARETGAQVVLIGIPEANAMAAAARSLADHPVYAELAQELKVPLYAGGWSRVLSDPALRSDPIHANAKGYEVFARGLWEWLRELGLAY
jgi:lysophospholipase L1-like esterase